MRARIRSWMKDERTHYAVAGAVLCVAFETWVRLTTERLTALESRGWVPVDDVATIGDLVNLRAELVGAPFDQDEPDEEAGP